eukprot:518891-Prorocentrum_minimum.AAC.4
MPAVCELRLQRGDTVLRCFIFDALSVALCATLDNPQECVLRSGCYAFERNKLCAMAERDATIGY